MAPELLQDRPFNKSVDVYAFGIVLWEVRWSSGVIVRAPIREKIEVNEKHRLARLPRNLFKELHLVLTNCASPQGLHHGLPP